MERITVQPAGMTEMDVDEGTQTFDEPVGPGQTRAFDMEVRVMPGRATDRSPINTLRVMVFGRNEKGPFTDSGDYGVGVELPER